MNKRTISLFAAVVYLIGCGALVSRAATNYVAQAGQTPSPKYLDWTTAASNIQDAIGVADIGNTVLVSNGTYNLTDQISILTNITVKSVNGKSLTFVNGNNYAGKAVTNRCFYMTNGVLDGFTIYNGVGTNINQYGGGVYLLRAGTVQNCTIMSNTCSYLGGGVFLNSGGLVSNCLIVGNLDTFSAGGDTGSGGGGAYLNGGGTLVDCIIASNTALTYGGGVVVYQTALVDRCLIYSKMGIIYHILTEL